MGKSSTRVSRPKNQGSLSLPAIRGQKIKKLKALHPLSRKAAKANKDLMHLDKKVVHIANKDLKYKNQIRRMEWFQKVVWMDQQPSYTAEELQAIAVEFICRHDDECIQALASSLTGSSTARTIAPTSKAGKYIKQREEESELMAKGQFQVPDLTQRKNVTYIREWKTGNVDQLKNVKMCCALAAEVHEVGCEPEY